MENLEFNLRDSSINIVNKHLCVFFFFVFKFIELVFHSVVSNQVI